MTQPEKLEPCDVPNCPSLPGKHIHTAQGRYIPECSWRRGEFHWICSEACN